MDEVLEILKKLGIGYKRYDHAPVKTCRESTELLPKDMPGVRTKHLFLHDRKKKNYFVIVVDENKMVDLKALSTKLNVKSLSMASQEELMEYFGVEAGALSMLAFINDKENRVSLIIDEDIWDEEAFDCQPNVCGVVLLIMREDFIKIFDYLKKKPEIVHIPEKSAL